MINPQAIAIGFFGDHDQTPETRKKYIESVPYGTMICSLEHRVIFMKVQTRGRDLPNYRLEFTQVLGYNESMGRVPLNPDWLIDFNFPLAWQILVIDGTDGSD